MILYFHFEAYGFEYPLPSCNDRRLRVDLSEMEDGFGFVNLEVWDNVWHIVSGNESAFTIDNKPVDDHILKAGDVIRGRVLARDVSFAVIVYDVDKAFATYEKYSLAGVDKLEIGSTLGSGLDILIEDRYASHQHATLRRQGPDMLLLDNSKNGTFVNNRRVSGEYRLDMMDDIYIAGVKLIYMGDFLAVNRPDKRVVKLPLYSPPLDTPAVAETSQALIRSPRILEPLDTETVEVEAPPQPQQQRRMPIVFTIGPAVTMPLPILASVLLTANQGSNFIMGTIMSVTLSAAVAAGWAVANVLYEKSHNKKDEALRKQEYSKYIAENEKYLKEKQSKNAAILNGQYLSLTELLHVLPHNKAVLWNRNANHPDFLAIRLGVGYVKSPCDIVVPKRRFSLVSDKMQSKPYELQEKYRLMPDCPSLVRLGETKIIGVLGRKFSVRQMAGAIAMQLATLHCYTDVKMAFLLRSGEEKYYPWARALPHTRCQDNKARLICQEDAERQNVLFYLSGALRSRKEAQRETGAEQKRLLPHIVVFCTSPALIEGENLYRYLADDEEHGVTFILLYEMMDRLPNECNHIIQCGGGFSGYYRLDKSKDETCAVRFDLMEDSLPQQLSRRLGGYVVTELSSGEIPSSVSFLEMYGATSLSGWDLLKRWKENRAYESLRAMIGISSGGKPLYLDIHEKQHGPHGLVAGTTGSGKSETIQTYILSLVMNFHPNEVSFILIDYKGGGMAKAFKGLPHLAGTITNLDGGRTIRALRSIRAEINRRQTLFNKLGVNHIDNYSRLFRDGTATGPMPHLIIISDEFAELKKEQPEFIKELVSTARVGRSLGVHLILATQKPSGVVDEEIWSNSRFKLCLRVQDKQDSNEMLHRPDAAYLTNTGRAYMQIGNDEVFELFQSGYSGAYYEPEDASSRESSVTMIGLDGSPLLLRRKNSEFSGEKRPTQLSASVDFIIETAKNAGVEHTRKLWKPELKEGVTLAEIIKSYPVPEEKGVTALCGLIDDPSRQLQYGASINFSAVGNALIAGIPGSGKSTMLQTILYSLVMNYTPEEVNLYCVDCSGALTKVFAELPHCGGVVNGGDGERVSRLFQLMRELAAVRARLFDNAAVGSFDEYQMVSPKPDENPMPMILLVIDNLYAFYDRYPEIADGQLLSMSHSCAKYGIHLVITANHISDVKYKLRQNLNSVFPLLLSERGDYHDALGLTPDFLPAALKGRGLWGNEALEFQAALARDGENEQLRAKNMRSDFEKAGYYSYSGFHARPVRFIPKDMPYKEFLAGNADRQSLAIGYNTQDISIVSLPLNTLYCYAVSAATKKAHENALKNMLDAASFLDAKRHMAALKYEPPAETEFDGIYRDNADILKLLLLLQDEFAQRSALKKELSKPPAETFVAVRERFGLCFVFIDSINEFLNIIYDVSNGDKYDEAAENFFRHGKGLGVYFIAGFEPNIDSLNMLSEAYKLFAGYGTGVHLGGQLNKQKLYDVPFLSHDNLMQLDITDGLTLIDDAFVNIFMPLNSAREVTEL